MDWSGFEASGALGAPMVIPCNVGVLLEVVRAGILDLKVRVKYVYGHGALILLVLLASPY